MSDLTASTANTYNLTVPVSSVPTFEELANLVYSDGGFCPDGGYIDDAMVDQWWHIYVACDHGRWRGVSNGPIDLVVGLQRAIALAKREHPAAVADA